MVLWVIIFFLSLNWDAPSMCTAMHFSGPNIQLLNHKCSQVQVQIWVPISVQVPVWSYRPHRGPIRGPGNFTAYLKKTHLHQIFGGYLMFDKALLKLSPTIQ